MLGLKLSILLAAISLKRYQTKVSFVICKMLKTKEVIRREERRRKKKKVSDEIEIAERERDR